MAGKRLSPSDSMFLYGESRETMMHVAGMLPFSPAPGSKPDHLRDLMDEIREAPVYSPWNLRATELVPRRFIRLRTLLPVRVGGHTSADAANSVEFVSELSENGIFVRTLHPRPVKAVVPVNLIIHSMAVKVKAVVLRSVTMKPGLFRDPGMGLKFVEISDTDRELLRNFIKGRIMEDITLQ